MHDRVKEHPQVERAKRWMWWCGVKGCVNNCGKPSGSRNPMKRSKAVKFCRIHMKQFHPELDCDSGIIKKVKE